MTRSSIALATASTLAVVVACDSRNPTSPNGFLSRPIYALTGTVTEPIDVPVEGATVTVIDGVHNNKSDRTDSAGHYTLIDVEGSFTVQVEKDGYVSAAKQVTVPQTATLDLEIVPLATTGRIGGNWTLTLEPDASSCPSGTNIAARKYRASIVQDDAQLRVTLSGAPFVTTPQLTGVIRDLNVSIELPGGCTDFYCYYGPTTPAVIENLAGTQFLGISGEITATVGRSAITGTLSGDFALMSHASPPFDIFTTCRSPQHVVTFTR